MSVDEVDTFTDCLRGALESSDMAAVMANFSYF